jgi:cation transport ATPase
MNTKSLIWIGLFIGSTIGGFLPMLWGANIMSFSSIILTAVGGILGIWFGYKLGNY